MPDQKRVTSVAFIATREAAPGEPSHIVCGYRMIGGRHVQYVGFFDRLGLESWLANGGPETVNDALNCVFLSFQAEGDHYRLPWFTQFRLNQADLFEPIDANASWTIEIPNLVRIAYFADRPVTADHDLQPLGGAWRDARPRLVLDLANDDAGASGSSLFVVLPVVHPGAGRKRISRVVVDHRLRHPLNGHARPEAGGPHEEAQRPAAALQLWHENDQTPWKLKDGVHYPRVRHWAAGVSFRDREIKGQAHKSWIVATMGGDPNGIGTCLHDLAASGQGGMGTLEGALLGVSSKPVETAIAALKDTGFFANEDGEAPRRFFGLARRNDPGGGRPQVLVPVLGLKTPLVSWDSRRPERALRLPSGFGVSSPAALGKPRSLRAVGQPPPSAEQCLAPAENAVWDFKLEIPARDLDEIPGLKGAARPLEAFRELLASKSQATAEAGGEPGFTFAPKFAERPFDGVLALEGELADKFPWRRNIEPGDIALTARPFFHLADPAGAAVWPAIRTHAASALAGGLFRDEPRPNDEEATQLEEDLGATSTDPVDRFLDQRARLRLSSPVSAEAPDPVRIGALDLRFRRLGGDPPDGDDSPRAVLTFGLAVARVGGQSGLRVQMLGHFPLDGASPAQPDRPSLDRDMTLQAARLQDAPDQALLLRLSAADKAAPTGSRRALRVTETFGWGLDSRLVLSLSLSAPQIAGEEPEPEQWMVLGRLPLQVAGLHMPALAGRADATDQQVAVWSSGAETGASWRLRDPDETARIILPPQGLGEAMEKGTKADGYDDIEPGKRAAFRLTPVALAEIDPSPLDSGFVEPAWNLDRVFGRPGVIEPGARLRRLAYELLYGMSGALSDGGLKGAHLRISDVSARYGVPPSRLSRTLTSAGDEDLQAWIDRWNSLRRVSLTRPMALSVSRTDRFESFEMDGLGVDFRLRSKARLKYPIVSTPAPDRAPWTHALPDAPDGQKVPGSEAGHLAGGVSWGFESRNILESVYAQPRSNAGRVRDLVLTPLGGYGNVRGLFDNRRTAIEATVALGRTSFYALERVGRIGALWNRAKHVIVYKREVLPSAQFYNEVPIGKQQDEHAGRVVLRKFDEYIEILQPERRYPDLADAKARTGFVQACRFHSKRIKVDSRWGSDVPGGWMVPLWKGVFRDLKVSTEDSPAAVYPKPQIALVCAGRGGQEHEQEIKYPEKLVFFASTRPGETDDTDAWAVTELVDWADELWPEEPATGGAGSKPLDARLAAPITAPPEQGRFAVELIRGEPVAVAHGFEDEPPLAGVDCVTISRASPKARPTDRPELQAHAVLPVLDQLRGLVGDVRAVTGNLRRELTGVSPSLLAEAQRKELARRTDQARQAVSSLANAARNLRQQDGAARVLAGLDAAKADHLVGQGCDEVRRLLRSAVDTRVAGLKEELGHFAGQLDGALAGLDAQVVVADASLETRLVEAGSSIDGVFAVALMILDRAEFAGLEAGAQVSGHIERARDEVVRMFAIFDDWREAQAKARQNLDDLLEQTRSLVEADLKGFGDACRALDRGIAGVRVSLADAQAGLIQALEAARARQSDIPASLEVIFRDVLEVLERTQARLGEELESAPTRLLYRIEQEAKGWATLPADKIDALKAELSALVDQADDDLKALAQEIETAIQTLAQEATALVDGAVAGLTQVLAAEWPAAIAHVRRPLEVLRVRIHARLHRCARLPLAAQTATARAEVADARRRVSQARAEAARAIDLGGAALVRGGEALAKTLCDDLRGRVLGWRNDLIGFLDAAGLDEISSKIDVLTAAINGRATDLKAGLSALENEAKTVIDKVEVAAEQKRAELGRLFAAADRAAATAESVLQKGDRALTLMRALGDPPKVEMLDFNRPGVAYIFNGLEQRGVKLTPIVAQVNRAAGQVAAVGQAGEALNDLLSEFGVRIPFRELGKTLTPDALENFDLSQIFPQFGGLDLSDLLGGEKFPSLNGKYGDALRVSHGFKPEEGRAWLECKVNTPLSEAGGRPRRVFALGPVQLDLLKGHFGADARFEARVDGGASKQVSGAIRGDWQLTVYGTRLVTFVETALSFDDRGRFDFDIQAEKIRLADALQYLVQLLQTFGGETLSKVRPIEVNGKVVGMTAPFTLSIGDLEFGAFSISAIQINCEFTVMVSPEFMFSVRADVNSKMTPFTLAVGTMIGGGYLTSYTQVTPARGWIEQRMSIAVMAGIGRPLNIMGVARGHGYLQFGVEIELYFSTRGGGAGGAVIAFIIASGNLVILGVVNCNITLRLETRYDTSGGASASGHIKVRVKITFFWTLKVDRAANYALSGGGGGGGYSDSFA